MINYEQFKKDTMNTINKDYGRFTIYENGESIVLFSRSFSYFIFNLEELYISCESDYRKCIAHIMSNVSEDIMVLSDTGRFIWTIANFWGNLKVLEEYYTLRFYDMVAILQYRVSDTRVVSVKKGSIKNTRMIQMIALGNTCSMGSLVTMADKLSNGESLYDFQYLDDIYYLSNKDGISGAVQIINYKLLDSLVEKYCCDLILMPVWTHGIAVIPECMVDYDTEYHCDVLHRMNINVTEHRFVLSYNIFKYCGNNELIIYKRGI